MQVIKSNLDKSFYVLLAILFLLPFPLGSNRPWAWSFFQVAIFVVTIFVILNKRQYLFSEVQKYWTAILLWVGFIGICSLQIIPLPAEIVESLSPTSFNAYTDANATKFFLSTDVSQSKISLNKTLTLFCIFFLILVLVNSEQRIKLLLLTIVASGTAQALYGSLEMLLNVDVSMILNVQVGDSATGSFIYRNHYSNFLMLCSCAGVGLLITSIEKNQYSTRKDFLRSIAQTLLSSKALIRICLVLMVIGLVMSKSRMGNVAFFVSLAFTGLSAILLMKNKSQRLFLFIISMFIVDLLIVSTYFGLDRIQERISTTSMAIETRDEVVKDSFQLLGEYSWFGSGGGSFYSTFPKYQVSEVHEFYDHLHNDYLQFAIEYGIIGISALTALLMFCIYKALRAMRKRRSSIFKGSSFACHMAILGMLIHMTLDFPLQGFSNACYFIVFLALSMVINSLNLRKR